MPGLEGAEREDYDDGEAGVDRLPDCKSINPMGTLRLRSGQASYPEGKLGSGGLTGGGASVE
jgi:hypothetical protein